MTKEYEQRARIFQQAMKSCHSNNPADCVEWLADRIIELEEANKANKWHYPSKGKYPKEYEDILICFLTEDDMKDCVRGWYEYDLDEDEHYFKTVNTFGTEIIKKPYAWKEIVPPKELDK